MQNLSPIEDQRGRWKLAIFAWVVMLLISDLPDILVEAQLRYIPDWFFAGKIGVLLIALGLSLVWRSLRPLWQYVVVLLVFFLSLGASNWLGDTLWWRRRFPVEQVSFLRSYQGFYLRDTGVALMVIASLWLMKGKRRAFFLTGGRLDAPIEPVPWLGIGKGESWRVFGWIFAVVAGVVVLVPTVIALDPSAAMLRRALPLLPAVLLLAAINAFTEEVYFRTSLLSTLQTSVGKTNALLISMVFFGLAHYLYGSPPGLIGAAMTGFLAYLLGKSILETKGLFWAWFIHFVPDVVIFFSYALLWRPF